MGKIAEEQNKTIGRDNLFFDAALFVIEKQEATTDMLKRKFKINNDRAERILSELESEGIVSSILDNNTRDVEMSTEEFSLIFNYKKPSDSLEEESAYSSKNKDQNSKSDYTSQKSDLPMWIKVLILIAVFLLTYFLTQRFVFFTSTRSDKSIPKQNNGWVQNGNNWNYYDANGNKLSKCIVDDGGKYYYLDDIGNLAVERWVDYNGKTFYVDKDGVILKNQWVGDFYVGNDGYVLKNTTTPDGYKVGSDGRYIAETKPVLPQTIVIRETVPTIISPAETTTIDPNYISYSVPNAAPDNIVYPDNGTNIIEPTPGYETANIINSTNSFNGNKANNYTIRNIDSYRQKSYLSNDRTCSVNLLIPFLVDKDGIECLAFREGMMQVQDNIVSELIDLADSEIEDNYDDGYISAKYISSISFSEARITSQDDYSLVIREVGKCNWNRGKDTKIRLMLEYDKGTETLSYYIEE